MSDKSVAHPRNYVWETAPKIENVSVAGRADIVVGHHK